MPSTTFRAVKPYEPSHPDAMAVYCSDGRFTDAVEELLHGLGHPRLDTMTLPGGPALFNAWLAGMSESMTVTAAARFLIEAHAIRRVILIAHEGCGFYKKHLPGAKPADVRKHQEEDLHRAAQALKSMPVVALLYVAVIDEGHVKFERVS
jgi:nitrogen regulatory protein PII-like uncharacterized protein